MDINVNETSRGMSPSLKNQTPGMDATRSARDEAMRQVAWLRENRAIVGGIVGGLVAIGLGTWLVLRARRPTRMEMLRDRGQDILDWLRGKLDQLQ
jgi:hypothetical protein